MKKFALIFTLITALLFISCSEEFHPKIDLEEQYALFCILNGDTTYQTAVITKSYDVDGFNPSDYPGNPYVTGADVKIKYNGAEYILNDTSVNSSSSAYPSVVYYTNNLQPEADKLVEVEALLPDGTVLTGTTITPKSGNIAFKLDERQSDSYITPDDEALNFYWSVVDADDVRLMYLPTFKIFYIVKENGIDLYKTITVPLRYYNSNNGLLPRYPDLSSYTSIGYSLEAVSTTMNLIGNGVEDKSNIYIYDAVFQILILDENLAPYYQTVEAYLDGFTVLLDQRNYSNISSGLGVLGSFYTRKWDLSFDPSYVTGFGYRIGR